MAPNGTSNGTSNGTAAANHRFDPNFTQNVINATGPKATPRVRQVIGSAIQHLHDWARENELTIDEWMQGLELINEAGRMSDDRRNEGQLVCDILGLESLVDEITYKLASEAADAPTATAILGPFYRKDSPQYPMGGNIVQGKEGEHGGRTWMHGRVVDFTTGKPIANAQLEVWHTAPNGLYEQQDPEQPDFNLRGRFITGPNGEYDFYCLRPVPYPIPYDGPAGVLLTALDRHPMRPAHIHFLVSAPNYKPIVTQVFDRNDKHLEDDSVFAVKDSLIIDFKERKGDPKADFEVTYDFRMASFDEAKKQSVAGATQPSTAGA